MSPIHLESLLVASRTRTGMIVFLQYRRWHIHATVVTLHKFLWDLLQGSNIGLPVTVYELFAEPTRVVHP